MVNSNRFDISKDIIDEAFSLDVGKCIDMELISSNQEGKEDMVMRSKVCRISETTIEVTGETNHMDGDVQKIKARYSRNVPIEPTKEDK